MNKFFAILFLLFSLSLGNEMKAQGCLDATVFLGAGSDNMLTFRGDEVSTLFWNNNSFTSPMEISDFMQNEPQNITVDAAFELGTGSYLVMQGSNISGVTKTTNEFIGDWISLTDYFPNLPSKFQSDIDAALAYPVDAYGFTYELYLFKGVEAIKYEVELFYGGQTTLIQGPVTGGWDGVFTEHFTSGVDAATYYNATDKIYFFSGNEYIRFDRASNTVDAGYPLPITDNWGSPFPNDWDCNNAIANGACDIGHTLPDFGCGQASSVNVFVSSASGTSLGDDVELAGVGVTIFTPVVDQLRISLVSPSGQEVLLSDRNGDDGDNYGSGCFSPTYFEDAASTSIVSGAAPFIGSFRPEEPLSNFNDGSNPNGDWQLKICDEVNGTPATLHKVELSFNSLVSSTSIIGDSDLLNIFPNPNNGSFTVEWENEGSKTAEIVILDILGRAVYQRVANLTGREQINLNDQPNGVYLVQLRSGEKIVSKKITIQ